MAQPPRIRPPVVPLDRPRDVNLGDIPAARNAPAQFAADPTAPAITHLMVTSRQNNSDAGLVQATDWNDDHKIVMPASSVIGRDASGLGPGQSLVLDNLGMVDDGFHVPTTDFVTKLIQDAVAIALNSMFTTGDICASVHWNKGGWLQMNGQTIGAAGSGAVFADDRAHDLFTLFWTDIYGVDWPINGGRGTSAEADWLAHKTIPLPDARGRVLGMVDQGANVATLLTIIGAPAGEQFHTLSIYETPKHTHQIPAHLQPGNGITGGGGSYLDATLDFVNDQVASGFAGGDGITGLTDPHLNMQPTLTIVYHIKL